MWLEAASPAALRVSCVLGSLRSPPAAGGKSPALGLNEHIFLRAMQQPGGVRDPRKDRVQREREERGVRAVSPRDFSAFTLRFPRASLPTFGSYTCPWTWLAQGHPREKVQ